MQEFVGEDSGVGVVGLAAGRDFPAQLARGNGGNPRVVDTQVLEAQLEARKQLLRLLERSCDLSMLSSAVPPACKNIPPNATTLMFPSGTRHRSTTLPSFRLHIARTIALCNRAVTPTDWHLRERVCCRDRDLAVQA